MDESITEIQEIKSSKKLFYVVMIYSRQAKRIVAKIAEMYPKISFIHLKQFSGYLFVEANTCTLVELAEISKITGVINVVKLNRIPIKSNIDTERLLDKAKLEDIKPGDRVVIKDGSFKDNEGIVEHIKDDKALVGIFFLGRVTPILISISDLTKK